MAARPRAVPTRTCVACRTARPKQELVRIVRQPAGQVVADASGRSPGRGAYLCADGACWRPTITVRALERALRTTLPPELITMLERGAIEASTEGGARGQE